MFLKSFGKTRAPEFPTDVTWLNSDPLTMSGLRGKPVLIDFWTYSCVNCLRTLPQLVRWHAAYKRLGLTIIGVHTPEFAFEKDMANVKKAMKDFGITYPVILDNDYAVWNLYANKYWPRKFLIDARGAIVHDHIGEGGYAEMEMAIQRCLTDVGGKELPSIAKESASAGDGVCYRTTPEIYLGYVRGHIGNADDYLPDVEEAYTDVSTHEADIPYLHGHWKISAEYIEHARALSLASEYILLKYSAFSVNIVAGGVQGKVQIEVEVDGQPVPEDLAGSDVSFKKGVATVTVDRFRMYNVIDADHYHSGTLKIKVKDSGVRLYTFTFGGCKS